MDLRARSFPRAACAAAPDKGWGPTCPLWGPLAVARPWLSAMALPSALGATGQWCCLCLWLTKPQGFSERENSAPKRLRTSFMTQCSAHNPGHANRRTAAHPPPGKRPAPAGTVRGRNRAAGPRHWHAAQVQARAPYSSGFQRSGGVTTMPTTCLSGLREPVGRAGRPRVSTGQARIFQPWHCRLIKSSGEQRFLQAHPEWAIHAQDRGSRFTAEKNDGTDCHVVAALSLEELLNRLDQIVAAQLDARPGQTGTRCGGSSSSSCAPAGVSPS